MTSIIPLQTEGKQTDLLHQENFALIHEAVTCFNRAHKRLLNPRIWHVLGGVLTADFYLADDANRDPRRLAEVHDYLKIDIPGPGPSSGEGYDWVRIEQLEDLSDSTAEEESVAIKLVPCSAPGNNSGAAAHFFTSAASSTFVITRRGESVMSSYHGRNESPNIKTDSVVDNVRNAVVSSGALASLSEAQWTALIKAFLKPEIGG